MSLQPVLIGGRWRPAAVNGTFRAENPATGEPLPEEFPISNWIDCEEALQSSSQAARELRKLPATKIAAFLDRYAQRIQERATELVAIAHQESGLPKSPRLDQVELLRTVNQLRLGAAAAAEGSWAMPTIDSKHNIRSALAPVGPVVVFGPNNFPFAFNSVAGGDFVAAIAAGNPVIAKANTSHPGVTLVLAKEAHAALVDAGLPNAAVQLIYRTSHADGERLVADPRVGATGYTGSRSAGLKLKAAAEAAGKLIYVELSSLNPVLVLPGALAERADQLVDEFVASSLMGTGQFCTNPSLVVLVEGEATEKFISNVKERFSAAPTTPLLSVGVANALAASVETLQSAGAKLLTGGAAVPVAGYRFQNTLLRVSGMRFVANAEKLQTEAFGNVALFVVARNVAEMLDVIEALDGNLTGCVYSDTKGSDDFAYALVEPALRTRVGRLLNDKMPTGVAVSPAMNHGGPYPSTGHPGFTAVGIPASLRRFAALHCYDSVRSERLPPELRDRNPTGKLWRSIDGVWTQLDLQTRA